MRRSHYLATEPLEDRTLLSAAGDANRDFQFDQRDVVQVLQGAKYLTGEPATWGEGDWTGDGRFDQLDIVAAQQTGTYLQGPTPDAPLDYEIKAEYGEQMDSGQLSAQEVEETLENVGYSEAAFIEFTTLPTIERFAPVLGFDRDAQGYPMSAEYYFTNMLEPVPDEDARTITWLPQGDRENGPREDPELGIKILCGRDDCARGMQNVDFNTLREGQIPTYYQVILHSTGRLRIKYWWFYGFQEHVAPDISKYLSIREGGAHHGDWEKVIVTTNPGRDSIEDVTYAQHNGWYTRRDFPTSGERPRVFVGRKAHGAYHNRNKEGPIDDFVEYTYFGAIRDPINTPPDDTWWNTSENLVSLMGAAEPWMRADKIGETYSLSGKEYKIADWHWGPRIWSRTQVDGEDTVKWFGSHGHPTRRDTPIGPTWTMGSCKSDGCDSSYNQGWAGINYYPIASIQSNTDATDLYPVENLIQGPGVGFQDGRPWQRVSGGPEGTWVTDACGAGCDYYHTKEPPVLTVDLGEDVKLFEINLWGYADTNSNGVSAFTLRFATEADGVDGFGKTINYNPSFSNVRNDEAQRQAFSFDYSVAARYVEVTCDDNHLGLIPGGDRVGLGEIGFPAAYV